VKICLIDLARPNIQVDKAAELTARPGRVHWSVAQGVVSIIRPAPTALQFKLSIAAAGAPHGYVGMQFLPLKHTHTSFSIFPTDSAQQHTMYIFIRACVQKSHNEFNSGLFTERLGTGTKFIYFFPSCI
jgi:hypothetical protein